MAGLGDIFHFGALSLTPPASSQYNDSSSQGSSTTSTQQTGTDDPLDRQAPKMSGLTQSQPDDSGRASSFAPFPTTDGQSEDGLCDASLWPDSELDDYGGGAPLDHDDHGHKSTETEPCEGIGPEQTGGPDALTGLSEFDQALLDYDTDDSSEPGLEELQAALGGDAVTGSANSDSVGPLPQVADAAPTSITVPSEEAEVESSFPPHSQAETEAQVMPEAVATGNMLGSDWPFGLNPALGVPLEGSPQDTSQPPSYNQAQSAVFQIADGDPPLIVYDSEPGDFSMFIAEWGNNDDKFDAAHKVGGEYRLLDRWARPRAVTRGELQGDECDIQGINWKRLQTTREKARTARKRLYRQHPSRKGVRTSEWAADVPDTENYFRFRRMHCSPRAVLSHFQLRHLLAATSGTDLFYAADQFVLHCDMESNLVEESLAVSSQSPDGYFIPGTSITSLAASENVVIAGQFNGEYALKNLWSEYPGTQVTGVVTQDFNAITNHIHVFQSRRSFLTQAAFCSNDRNLRILDCHTNKFIRSCLYDNAINCAATSADGRLRVVVGDSSDTLITDADSGRVFERLRCHDDHAFACAWADDGIHVATAAQDSQVVVYDARWWRSPITIIKSEMAFCRSLHFSPVGGGKRVLLAAEADDVINVIDARSFDRKQVLDFYGSVAGVAFAPDGGDFYVANCDPKFGGLMHYERAGGAENFGTGARVSRRARSGEQGEEMVAKMLNWDDEDDCPHEWVAEQDLNSDPRVLRSAQQRSRRGLPLSDVML